MNQNNRNVTHLRLSAYKTPTRGHIHMCTDWSIPQSICVQHVDTTCARGTSGSVRDDDNDGILG